MSKKPENNDVRIYVDIASSSVASFVKDEEIKAYQESGMMLSDNKEQREVTLLVCIPSSFKGAAKLKRQMKEWYFSHRRKTDYPCRRPAGMHARFSNTNKLAEAVAFLKKHFNDAEWVGDLPREDRGLERRLSRHNESYIGHGSTILKMAEFFVEHAEGLEGVSQEDLDYARSYVKDRDELRAENMLGEYFSTVMSIMPF